MEIIVMAVTNYKALATNAHTHTQMLLTDFGHAASKRETPTYEDVKLI
jgi:hypothetical protein